MSATTNPPTSTAQAAASATQSTIELPTSTVVSIGLGFVGVAAGLLSATFALRAFRVYKSYKQARARGEDTTFHQTWRNSGGWWGYFTSGLGNESNLIGGGGYAFEERQRRWREMMAILDQINADQVGLIEVGEKPQLFEVEVNDLLNHNCGSDMADEIWGEEMPLAVVTSSTPDSTIRSHESDPKLRLSIVIFMPSEIAESQNRGDPPDEGDIPDLVIGTTSLSPIILTKQLISESSDGHTEGETEKNLKADKTEIMELEYADEHDADGSRRARWVKTENGWGVEGIT